jgi:quercetin dioxygenase-like cupin family protein
MKIVQFTIPVSKENTIYVEEDIFPYFYNHLHRHNETQITWIVKGEGTLIVGDYMQTFTAGDVYIIGANQPHIFKNDISYFSKDSKLTVHSVTVFFNLNDTLKNLLLLPETKTINKFLDKTVNGLKVPSNKVKEITKEIENIKSNKDGYKLASFIYLLQLLADIKNWNTLASVSPENSFSDIEGLRMNNIYQHTMANYAEIRSSRYCFYDTSSFL